MLIYLGALDPRVWQLVVVAEQTARRRGQDPAWTPSRTLVRAYADRVGQLVGPGRVRIPGDHHPARALLFQPEAHAAVLERVMSGLQLGCVRRTTGARPTPITDPTAA